jgi:hypothetical protein
VIFTPQQIINVVVKRNNCYLVNVTLIRKREKHATFLVAKPKGKRNLERPTIMSNDIIQMDRKEE